MSKLHEAAGLGQSIWLNRIDRSLIHSGQLSDLIQAGVYGVTTHPYSFAKAVGEGNLYDRQLVELVQAGKSVKEIAESLLFTDIQTAVDLFHPTYERTHGVDGYVSLDINPALEDDVDGLVAEGLRLAYDVDRVNGMVQVPATPAGIEALKILIGEGTNVNTTHIYTVATYEAVAQAYLAGVDTFWTRLSVWRLPPAAVATLPVTRLDKAVDAVLANVEGGQTWRGQAGIATARVIYGRFREIFNSKEWKKLADYGSRLQRPLWESSDQAHYVHNLVGPNTAHSLPPAHVTAFLEESPMVDTLTPKQDEAQAMLDILNEGPIDLKALEEKLQAAAVDELHRSYQLLANTVTEERDRLTHAF